MERNGVGGGGGGDGDGGDGGGGGGGQPTGDIRRQSSPPWHIWRSPSEPSATAYQYSHDE